MKLEFTEDQAKALKIIKTGANCFITGSAGTGKSFLIAQVIKRLEKAGKSVLVTASTGVAAINIGGSTVHRALRIPVDPAPTKHPNKKHPSILKNVDVLILDEISMVRVDVFDYIAEALIREKTRRGHNIQVILVGDFLQLPPVIGSEGREFLDNFDDLRGKTYAWESQYWQAFGFKNLVLREIVRQEDKEFSAALDRVKVGDTSGVGWINKYHAEGIDKEAIILCPTNNQAKTINESRLSLINEKTWSFPVDVDGDIKAGDMVVDPEGLIIKKGARVMALVNNVKAGYVNGSCGYVVGFNRRSQAIKVRFDDGNEAEVERYTWRKLKYMYSSTTKKIMKIETGSYEQYPLKLAYAVTIHKSQGKTFDKVNIQAGFFEKGQLYVALSRCSSIEGLHFIHDHITIYDMMVDEKNVDFFRSVLNNNALDQPIEEVTDKVDNNGSDEEVYSGADDTMYTQLKGLSGRLSDFKHNRA